MRHTKNHYTVTSNKEQNPHFSKRTAAEFEQLADRQREQISEETLNQNVAEGQDAMENDPVERNRNRLEIVKSVFLPDGAFSPAHNEMPVNFLTLKGPYSQTIRLADPHASLCTQRTF